MDPNIKNQTYLSKLFQRSLRASYAFGHGTACTLSLPSIGEVSVTRPSLNSVLIALSIGISTCKTQISQNGCNLSCYLFTCHIYGFKKKNTYSNNKHYWMAITQSLFYLYFKCIIHESLTFVSYTLATSDLHLAHFLGDLCD